MNDECFQSYTIDYFPAAGCAGQGMRIGADSDHSHVRRMDSGRDRGSGYPEQGTQRAEVQSTDLSHLSQQQPYALRVLIEAA